MTALTPDDPRAQVRFEELMQAGRDALAEGRRERAHDLWRQAATLNPYAEKVWIALLRVLDSDEDRIVCLQNIVAINPVNAKAREQLRLLRERVQRSAEASTTGRGGAASRRRRKSPLRSLVLILLGLLTGAAVGIAASIIVYGL